MVFASINYLAVAMATLVGFAAGAAWYRIFGPQWMAALGKTKADLTVRPRPFVVALVAQLVMAFILAGTISLFGSVTIHNGVVVAAFVWLGFVATTIAVNHGFQGLPVSLTMIDAGHWLAVLVLMGATIGFFGI
jgi:hypothetical protein